MRNYEVTFIVDPTLSNDEIKSAAKKYEQMLADAGKIVFINEIGLRQLAYPIRNRNTGIYYCIEFEVEDGTIIDKLELTMRRDEQLLRFLSVKLDKYGVKYNEDKRAGKIGTIKKKKKVEEDNSRDNRRKNNRRKKPSNSNRPQNSGAKETNKAPKAPAE